MNLDKIVCNCMSITNGMIKDAVASGATTLEEVQEIIGSGTVCGACLDNVKRLVDEFAHGCAWTLTRPSAIIFPVSFRKSSRGHEHRFS